MESGQQTYSDRFHAWVSHLRNVIGGTRVLRIAVMGPQRRFAVQALENQAHVELVEGESYIWPVKTSNLDQRHTPIAVITTNHVEVAKRFFEMVSDANPKSHKVAVWVGALLQKPVYPENADEFWQFNLKPSLSDYVHLAQAEKHAKRQVIHPKTGSTGLRFTPGLILDPVNDRQMTCIERLVREIEEFDREFSVEEPECRSDALHLVKTLQKKVAEFEPQKRFCEKCRTSLGATTHQHE